jgi:cytochrome c-type biogenesis protein CcmE
MKQFAKNNRKYKRLLLVLLGVGLLTTGVSLLLVTLNENIVFFLSPTEIIDKKQDFMGKTLRIGGIVESGTIQKHSPEYYEFVVTDYNNSMRVKFKGIPPNLFREGQGVVAKGKIKHDVFIAEELLAKHDENYMPKEIVESLKKSGQWREDQ